MSSNYSYSVSHSSTFASVMSTGSGNGGNYSSYSAPRYGSSYSTGSYSSTTNSQLRDVFAGSGYNCSNSSNDSIRTRYSP